MQKKLGVSVLVFAFILLLGVSALVYKKSSKIDSSSQLAATAVPTITNVTKTNLTSTGVTITWNTGTVSNGNAQVKKSWSTAWSTAVTETNSGTAHSVTITNLTPQTKYNYKVTSCEISSSKCNTYTSSSTFTTTAQTATDTTAPTTPTNATVSNITASGATISWTASTDAVGVTGYNIYPTGSNAALNTTAITATSYVLTGLNPSSPYSFAIKAKDAAGNMSALSNSVTFSTIANIDSTAPTAPSNLALISKTYNSIAFSWTGSTDNVGVTGYRVYRNGVDVDGTTTATSITLSTGINPATTYSLTVYAKDAAGNMSPASAQLSVTTDTQPDTQAPTIPTNLASSNITSNSADISWYASTDNVGVVEYQVFYQVNNSGPTLAGGTISSTSINISNLTENTTYTFTIKSKDAAGNLSALSAPLPVTTLTDIPPAPTNLSLISKTYNSASMQWTAPTTTGSAIASYEVYESGVKIGSTTTATSITAINLTGSTNYSFTVKAVNALGHTSANSTPSLLVTTDAAPDTQAPTTPTGLNAPATEVTTNSLNLYWTASTDNVGVTEYQVFQNGTLIGGTTTALSMPVTGLIPSTAYSFTIKSKDAAGNLSPMSTPALSVTTKTAADTTPPTAPTNATASSILQTSALISWNASTDNVGVAGYNVYKNGSTSAANTTLVTSTSRNSTGLTAGTPYTYVVRAVDAAGNLSVPSNSASFTTLPVADTTAPTISAISSIPNTTGATITWTTNEASDSQMSYGTTTSYGTTSVLDTTLTTSHSVTITGLTSGTLYHFKVTSKDAAANSASSVDQTFTTTTSTTTGCLNIATNPADARDVWAWHGNTQLITPNSTFQTNFFNYADSHKVQTIYLNANASFVSGNATNIKDFLNKAKAHCMDVEALGGAENWIVTPGNPYITPAGVNMDTGSGLTTDARNLRVSNVSLTTATLTWDAPTDTTGLSGYNIYKNTLQTNGTYTETKVNSSLVTVTTYNLTGLTEGKNYTYRIKTVDGLGNVSTTQGSNLLKFGMYTNEATGFATAVKNLNDSITGTNAKFSAIQYDVEPHTIGDTDGYYPYYGLSDGTYTIPQANMKIMNALIDTMQSVKAITGSSVKVTLAPPRWYDSSPNLQSFNRTGLGVTGKNAMQYLFDTVDILAIQDYVTTDTNIHDDASGELNYAAANGKKVKVGILLDSSTPASSTFFGSTCANLNSTLQSAYNLMTATEKSGFAGFAIEQYDTLTGYNAGTPSSWTAMCP